MTTIPDPYSEIEDGIADRLRATLAEAYFLKEWQVADNDYNLTFGAEHYAITRPGPFPRTGTSYKSGEIQQIDWTTFVHLYVRFAEKEEQWSRFKAFRSAVIWTVMQHRFLGTVVINDVSFSEVKNVDRIQSIEASDTATYWRFFNTPETSPPNFMYQPVRIVTRQRVRFV